MTTKNLQQLYEDSTDQKVHQKLELVKYNPDYVRWLENIIVNNPALDPQNLKFDQEKSVQDPFYKPFYLKEIEPKSDPKIKIQQIQHLNELLIQMKNNPELIKLQNAAGDIISLKDCCVGWTCKINNGNEFFISSFWGQYPGQIQISGNGKI